jgi:chemotaxis protein MotB
VQFWLREPLCGQATELNELSAEVAALAEALGLERDKSKRLEGELGQISATLDDAQAEVTAQSALIASLTQARTEQDRALRAAQAQITDFEAQVASLLAQRDEARGNVAALEAEKGRLLSDKEALELALAQARDEIDAGVEAARLAAARRDALEQMIAQLEREAETSDKERGSLVARVDQLESALSAEEAARLAEAAAAKLLRDRLAKADAELTAMTLALEEQRRKAEETLTLLAAAEKAGDDLDLQLAAALLKLDETEAALNQRQTDLEAARNRLAEAEQGRQVTFGQLTRLEADLAAALTEVEDRDAKLAQLLARIGVLEKSLGQANRDRDDLQSQLIAETASLGAELAAEEQARASAEALAERNAKDRDATRAELETQLAEARAKAAAAQAALQAELDRLRGDLGDRVTAMDAAELRIVALEAALARSRSETSGLQERLDSALVAKDQAAALQQDKAQLEGALEAAQKQVEADANRIGQLEQRIATLEALIQTATRENEAAQAKADADIASLRERLAIALAAKKVAEAASADREDLKRQLAAALAQKLKAQEDAAQTLSEAEKRAILLRQAEQELQTEQAKSAETARRTALLNQQVAQLRSQLASLQALLDDAQERDEVNQVQLKALGSQLNAALAQKAAEERKRRLLEEAERKRLEEEAQQLEKYKSDFFGQLREVFEGREGVRIVGDRFVFSSEVLFDPGSADLSGPGQRQIAGIAATLRSLANEIPDGIDWVLRVDGHTDNVPLSGQGEFRDNWELSQARALSVVRYMTNFLGFPPNRLSANGFGQYQPIAAGDSSAARAANRRIELKFTER